MSNDQELFDKLYDELVVAKRRLGTVRYGLRLAKVELLPKVTQRFEECLKRFKEAEENMNAFKEYAKKDYKRTRDEELEKKLRFESTQKEWSWYKENLEGDVKDYFEPGSRVKTLEVLLEKNTASGKRIDKDIEEAEKLFLEDALSEKQEFSLYRGYGIKDANRYKRVFIEQLLRQSYRSVYLNEQGK